MIRDNSKCVLCRRCVAVCRKYQDCGVIGPIDRGFKTHIGSAFEKNLGEVALCILRPVHRCLPDRRFAGKGYDRRCLGCPVQP